MSSAKCSISAPQMAGSARVTVKYGYVIVKIEPIMGSVETVCSALEYNEAVIAILVVVCICSRK